MNNLEKSYKKFASDRKLNSLIIDDYNKKVTNQIIEPYIIEERSRNITQMSVFSRLFVDRILFLGGEIDSDVANILNSQLLFLESEEPEKPITLYINSPGGSCVDGMSIYDIFNFISSPIHTTCIGLAASMGALLLSSGEKEYRNALPHSKIMIHQPSGGAHGMASDIEIQYQEITKYKEDLTKILAENSGQSYEDVLVACDRDRWMTAAEAVNFGLIDTVISKNSK